MNTYLLTGTVSNRRIRSIRPKKIKARTLIAALAIAKRYVVRKFGTKVLFDINVRRPGFTIHTPLPE